MSTELYSNAHVDMFDFEGPLLLKLRALAEKQRRKEREQQLSDVFSMLVQTLRAKDEQLYRHSSRVMYFTQHLSQLLSLRPGTITMINLGALFHDIGKIGLSNTLLHKASRLTEQEFVKVKEHPVRGAFILSHMPVFQKVASVVHFHHEWWNGAGYPCGVRGEAIPLGARMVAIADAYEVMTSRQRTYRKPYTHWEALAELRRCAGMQFDPVLVYLFCTSLEPQRLQA